MLESMYKSYESCNLQTTALRSRVTNSCTSDTLWALRQLQAENDEHEKNRQKPPPKQHDDDVNYVNFLLKVQLWAVWNIVGTF